MSSNALGAVIAIAIGIGLAYLVLTNRVKPFIAAFQAAAGSDTAGSGTTAPNTTQQTGSAGNTLQQQINSIVQGAILKGIANTFAPGIGGALP